MARFVAAYAALLAGGTLLLELLDYGRVTRGWSSEGYAVPIAALFLALGAWIGARALARPAPQPFDGNPQALAALGISERELEVLHELAAGRSNKEIARRLQVSPNTVKTHVARLYEKLGAQRRTAAVNRARELGILA